MELHTACQIIHGNLELTDVMRKKYESFIQ